MDIVHETGMGAFYTIVAENDLHVIGLARNDIHKNMKMVLG